MERGHSLKPISRAFEDGAGRKQRGTLYVVGTPIGNLEDITLRALRTLKEVDLIACEDTRRTQKLLNAYQIKTHTTSYHEHNEFMKAPELVLALESGEHIALVSDAGTPGISDPGYRLVLLCVRHGIRVVPIPGASAFVAALVASGLPTDSFRFHGFLPAKRAQRVALLEQVKNAPRTMIFYEAPHRLYAALEDILEVLGDRSIVVAREVTKVHEEFLRGTVSEVMSALKNREIKGEITVIVDKANASVNDGRATSGESIRAAYRRLTETEGFDRQEALKWIARERGLSKGEVFRQLEREK